MLLATIVLKADFQHISAHAWFFFSLFFAMLIYEYTVINCVLCGVAVWQQVAQYNGDVAIA